MLSIGKGLPTQSGRLLGQHLYKNIGRTEQLAQFAENVPYFITRVSGCKAFAVMGTTSELS